VKPVSNWLCDSLFEGIAQEGLGRLSDSIRMSELNTLGDRIKEGTQSLWVRV